MNSLRPPASAVVAAPARPTTAAPSRPLELVVAAQWIAVLAGVGAALAIVWPEAARPILSVLVGLVLVAVAIVVIRSMLRRLPHPHAASPFNRRGRDDTVLLPSELLRITNAIDPVRPNRSLPDSAVWTLRRIAVDRLVQRHGRRLPDSHLGGRDTDVSWLIPLVSPALLRILGDDVDRRGIPAADLPELITEVEKL